MTIGEITAISTICLGLIGVMFKLQNIADQKRNRVYERLDNVKEHLEQTMVSKEVCSILHNQIKDDIQEIKTDLKLLLRKNGIGDK